MRTAAIFEGAPGIAAVTRPLQHGPEEDADTGVWLTTQAPAGETDGRSTPGEDPGAPQLVSRTRPDPLERRRAIEAVEELIGLETTPDDPPGGAALWNAEGNDARAATCAGPKVSWDLADGA